MTRVAAVAGALLAASLVSGTVSAGEEDGLTFFSRGRQLRLEGKCGPAVVQFELALESDPGGLGSLRNIAECQEELGKHASARRSWWLLRQRVMQSGKSKYDGWVADAEAAHARLASTVPRLTVRVVGVAGDDLRVTVDGERLEPTLWGTELERDVGRHTVAAVRGEQKEEREVILDVGKREVVEVPAPPPLVAPPGETPPAAGGNAMVIGGAVGLSVAGLSLVGLGVSLGVRQSAVSSLERDCPSYETTGCSAAVQDAVSRGQTASTLVNVFAVAAGVGAAAGVPLLVLGLHRDDASTPRVNVAPGVGSIHIFGRF